MAIKPAHVLLGIGLLAAGGIAYLATRTAGPVPMPAFTEMHNGRGCLHYPPVVAPNLAYAITHGFAPPGVIADPVARAQPAEKAW